MAMSRLQRQWGLIMGIHHSSFIIHHSGKTHPHRHAVPHSKVTMHQVRRLQRRAKGFGRFYSRCDACSVNDFCCPLNTHTLTQNCLSHCSGLVIVLVTLIAQVWHCISALQWRTSKYSGIISSLQQLISQKTQGISSLRQRFSISSGSFSSLQQGFSTLAACFSMCG